MAKIREIITRVDENKPNAFSSQQKLRWIAELDGRIALDVLLMSIVEARQMQYGYPDGLEITPLVEFPFDGIYDAWLEAQIDYKNGEYNEYQNAMEWYNAQYVNMVRWFAQTYEPANGYGSCTCDNHPPYFLTAYGLAVQHGYQGTLEEWLDSLHGEQGDKVELRYDADHIQWRWVAADGSHDLKEPWHNLVPVAEIRGKVVEDTLDAARKAAENAGVSAEVSAIHATSAKDAAENAKNSAESAEKKAENISFGLSKKLDGSGGITGICLLDGKLEAECSTEENFLIAKEADLPDVSKKLDGSGSTGELTFTGLHYEDGDLFLVFSGEDGTILEDPISNLSQFTGKLDALGGVTGVRYDPETGKYRFVGATGKEIALMDDIPEAISGPPGADGNPGVFYGSGDPPAWAMVQIDPEGEEYGNWELINSFSVSQEDASVVVSISADSDGNPFSLEKAVLISKVPYMGEDFGGWWCINGTGSYNSGIHGFGAAGISLSTGIQTKICRLELLGKTLYQQISNNWYNIIETEQVDIHEIEVAGHGQKAICGEFALWGVRR